MSNLWHLIAFYETAWTDCAGLPRPRASWASGRLREVCATCHEQPQPRNAWRARQLFAAVYLSRTMYINASAAAQRPGSHGRLPTTSYLSPRRQPIKDNHAQHNDIRASRSTKRFGRALAQQSSAASKIPCAARAVREGFAHARLCNLDYNSKRLQT